ncbi:MAG: ribonuclease P protein component [Raoultibacter sp.]
MLETIKSSIEISHLFKHGFRLNSSSITLLVSEDTVQHDRRGRVAFVAGKKNGNAVWRNAAKRRMRALCQELNGPWQGYDVIFIAKKQTTQASYSKVLEACNDLLMRKGLR